MNLQLQRLRKKAGFKTQKDMAERLGIPERTYASWERQEVMMNLEQAYNCAVALGCTINDLVGIEPPKSPAFPDPRQEALNGCYESMNETGRKLAVDSIRAMSAAPELRMVKEREGAYHREAMGS